MNKIYYVVLVEKNFIFYFTDVDEIIHFIDKMLAQNFSVQVCKTSQSVRDYNDIYYDNPEEIFQMYLRYSEYI